MGDIDVSRVDFHALRVLVEVHDTGSLTAAAERVGATQSTVSYTLDRLRRAFGDALFVRQGRGVAPTPRCDEIVPQVRELSRSFAKLVRPQEFDPGDTTRVARICCNYYERSLLLPGLVERIGREAPGVRIKVRAAEALGHAQLLEDKADILFSPVVSSQSGLMVRQLLSDRYVCLVSADDPRRHGLSLEAYRDARHIVVNYEGVWTPFYITHLRRLGIEIDALVELPSFGGVAPLIRAGDCILTVPRRVAGQFGPDFVAIPAPFDVRFDLKLFWSARAQGDPFVRWLRDLIVAECGEVLARG